MKRMFKRLMSLALALALTSSAISTIPFTASAAEEMTEIVKWEFDGNDTYANNWSKGGYTTSGLTPTYTITDGHLKVDEDYTSLSSTYNRVMAQYNFTETAQLDISEATKLTFDYYCPTGSSTPSSMLLVFSGKLSSDVSSTTKTDSATFSTAATKYAASDIADYDKYAVSIDLTSTDDFVTQRAHVARMQIGEIRTNTTFKGAVYYDNIAVWKLNENAPKASIDKKIAVYNESISVNTENMDGEVKYQWYKATSYAAEGVEIENATNASYVPERKNIGGYLYCTVTSNNKAYTSNRVRVAAGDTVVRETNIKLTNTTIAENSTTCFFVNTTATGTASSYFDISKIVANGYFYFEYTGELSEVPQLELGTWSTNHSTADVTATETGIADNGNKYAKYSYDACVNAWGDEDFSDFKAVRAKYTGSDSANLTFVKVSWFGYPTSFGDLGESVAASNSGMLFTAHVGGDFDVTRVREDSYFYLEYAGDEDGIEFVVNSHSKVVGGSNQYTVIGSPAEIGETGSGYYRIYTAEQIKKAFGTDMRHIDQIRVNTKDSKTITTKKLYFFEGTGDLVDDISKDGYTDVLDVPWPKYADESQDGVVIIGASITQNPLVTSAALEGSPYYHAQGGWNALLDRTDCITYGIGSQTTINVARRFKEILKYDYKQIIIQCGNNDLGAFYNNTQGAVDQEVGSYTTMLDQVKAKNIELEKAGKDPIKVHIISLNPTNSENLQSTIIAVNNAIKALSDNYDFVTYIDIYNDFVNDYTGSPTNPDCDEYHVNMDLVMPDGLHPVSAGYKIWAGYLKETMQSTDTTDTTLQTLSYRISDTERKNAVAGFATGTSTGTNNVYNAPIPRTTEDNATFKLYVTPSNLNATVSSSTGDVFVDEYGDAYIEVTLENGTKTITLTVESADKTSSETYVINFKNNGSVIGQKVSVTDETVSTWPWVEFSGGDQTVYSGATVDFDVAIDNDNFTGIWLETDFNWTSFKTVTLKPEDFTNGIAHVTAKYIGETIDNLAGIEVKTGTDITDYRGDITFFNMQFTNGENKQDIEVEGLKEIILFEGEEKATDVVKSIFTNNNFNTDNITEDGYFYVTYKATAKDPTIRLALSDWETSRWLEIAPTASGEISEGVYYAKFSYDACVNMYDSQDFSDVDAISVKSSNIITLTKISWFGHPINNDLGEKATILFEGNSSAEAKYSCLKFFYTKHVGGEWDASVINEGSYFYTEYVGAEGGVSLALSSSSGAARWAEVTPDETGKTEDGRWYSIYKYETFAKVFGTNFARLDQIQARTLTNEKVTLKRIAYFDGEGDPVDTTDGTWDRPDSGIAFIGDSIIENPHVDSEHLGAIDWNGILGKTDCVNYGIGGQTTKELTARIDEVAKKNYDKVVMLCGINDIGHGLTNEQIIANYKTMFEALKAKNPDVEIFLMSVLPTTPVFYTDAQGRIRELDAELEALAGETENVTFVNIYPAFYDESTGYCKDGLTFDGLHPNLTGYALIADILNPYLNGTENIKIYYQLRNEYDIRFIAEVDIESVQSVSEAFEETLVAGSDAPTEFESVYGVKSITKAYKSLVASGKTVTAPQGKCYLISTPVCDLGHGDKAQGIFILNDVSINRNVQLPKETIPEIPYVSYKPTEDNVKLLGRTDYKGDSLWLAYSAAGAEYQFTGTSTKISITGDTQAVGAETGARIVVYADGKRVKDVMLTQKNQVITVDLDNESLHIIKVMKVSESANSTVLIDEIAVNGEGTIAPTEAIAHKIEFIGDSITCGYGIDGANQYEAFKTKTEDGSRTYAYKTATLLNADYSMVSVSGSGVVSGYTSGSTPNTENIMPTFYGLLGHSWGWVNGSRVDDVAWDFNRYVPELVVINLGTNDASYTKGDAAKIEEYANGYVDFIKMVREKNPNAEILCTLGIMGQDLYPAVETAVDKYIAETGDTKVNSMMFDVQDGNADGYGSDWHPSEATHVKAAYKLADKIAELYGWEINSDADISASSEKLVPEGGSTTPETPKPVTPIDGDVVWTGSAVLDNWSAAVSLGIKAVSVEKGGVLTLVYKADGSATPQIAIATQQGENFEWIQLTAEDGNQFWTASASDNTLKITLTAEQAELLSASVGTWLGGAGCTVIQINYTAPAA